MHHVFLSFWSELGSIIHLCNDNCPTRVFQNRNIVRCWRRTLTYFDKNTPILNTVCFIHNWYFISKPMSRFRSYKTLIGAMQLEPESYWLENREPIPMIKRNDQLRQAGSSTENMTPRDERIKQKSFKSGSTRTFSFE